MIDHHTKWERAAREWLSENIGPSDIDSELNKSLTKLLAFTERRVLEEAVQIAESDPELPGPMPENVRVSLLALPLDEQQRAAVRSTKKSIAKRLLQRAKERGV